jgi:hypothetical protein
MKFLKRRSYRLRGNQMGKNLSIIPVAARGFEIKCILPISFDILTDAESQRQLAKKPNHYQDGQRTNGLTSQRATGKPATGLTG